ncbi:MAG: hint domain protein [Hyphomicrobiales bacterium]|nr:hint domain protein [Hyphomicrobiales bacterium]
MSQRAGVNSSGGPVSRARRDFLALTATGAGLALTLLSSAAIAKDQQSNGKGSLLDAVLGSGKDRKSKNNNNGNAGKDDKGGKGRSGGKGNAYGQGGGNGGGGGGNNARGNGNGNAYGRGGVSIANSGGNGAGFFCFLKGTRILTLTGEVRIADLRVGDHVLTVDDRDVETRCIGRHSYAAVSSSASDETMPIRISRQALDDRSPQPRPLCFPAARVVDRRLPDAVQGARQRGVDHARVAGRRRCH